LRVIDNINTFFGDDWIKRKATFKSNKTSAPMQTMASIEGLDDDGVDEALVKALAKRKVMRVVFKDTGFAKDEIKDNVEQIFKHLPPETEVRAV